MPQKIILDGPNPQKFILLGEDDKDDQEMLKDVFESIDNSFILLFVNNGKELMSALSKLGDHLPCLIVLDYNMPEMNGAEILREINKEDKYREIPKLVWSTSGADMYKKNCLELGAMEYLIKPTKISDLEEMVKYMLSICLV